MIEKLVVTLEQKVKDLTSEEIADILWLTLQQWQSDLSQKGNTPPVPPDSETSQVETLVSGNTVPIPPPSGEVVSSSSGQKPETAGLTTQKPQNKSETQNSADLGAPLAIPDSPSLRRSLDILRAIRPLIRLVPSAVDTYLDVPATVKTIAETEILTVKLRPVLEPWLELALVVDATPSMVIWQRTVLNLRRVLAQSGVFRDVRLWSLETVDFIENIPDSSEPKITQRLRIRSGFGTATASQPPCRPQELLDPNGRRLILVVSDCIDLRWDAQPIRDLLQVWANHGAMGLVQVLPEWLWSRTALTQVTKGQMVGVRPGQPSQSLTFVRRKRSLRSQPTGVKVPVMTLEPDVTNRWSQMVAGKSSISSAGLVFAPVSVQELADGAEFESQESEEPTPQERLAQFRAYSSPMARQLAGLLAACPEVNLPVVRMVQAALLPDSQQVNVAEVLLGGLFKSQTEITAYTPADRVQYVFHDGVKPLVQETISPKQAFNVLSAWVMRRFGYALEDFRAYLTEDKSEEIQPFAGVMLDVLNRQSSQNIELIERIKEVSGLGKSDEVDKLKEGEFQSEFPELEVLHFTTAQSVEAGAEVQLWPPDLITDDFTIVTFYEDFYGQLRQYLGEARWRDADIETNRLMLEILGRKGRVQFTEKELLNFPCEDLQIIDCLWQESSKGIFGFSIQKRIFSEFCGGEIQWNNWVELFQLVGWHDFTSLNAEIGTESGGWLRTTTYSIDAPKGHLPVLGVGDVEGYEYAMRAMGWLSQDWFYRKNAMQHLFSRLDLCQSYSPQQLQPFEFEVATVVKLNDQWEIQRQPSRAYQFIEQLPDNLPLEMVSIPAGTCLMGSPADEPERYEDESHQHKVEVGSFFMGRYPITQAQWRVVSALSQKSRELNPDPSRFKGDNRPVEQVSWYEAVEFCDRLAKYTGRPYRLPSEAEWEYACRAGTQTPFIFGETITGELANYSSSATYRDELPYKSRGKTTPVDQFSPNQFGISDMHGNVLEWCQDHWHENYEGAPFDGSPWLSEENDANRVFRGGAWDFNPRICRSAYRAYGIPDFRNDYLGFRVVCSAPRALQ